MIGWLMSRDVAASLSAPAVPANPSVFTLRPARYWWFGLLLSAVLVLIGIIVAWRVLTSTDQPDGPPQVIGLFLILPAVLCLVGCGVALGSVRRFALGRKLGAIQLHLDSTRPALGGDLSGTIQFENAPPEAMRLEIRLECSRRLEGDSPSVTLHQDSKLLSPAQRVRFCLPLPRTAEPSTPELVGDSWIVWTLAVVFAGSWQRVKVQVFAG